VNEIKAKALERECLQRLRQAIATLSQNKVLPQTMSIPIGTWDTDIGAYRIELRLALAV